MFFTSDAKIFMAIIAFFQQTPVLKVYLFLFKWIVFACLYYRRPARSRVSTPLFFPKEMSNKMRNGRINLSEQLCSAAHSIPLGQTRGKSQFSSRTGCVPAFRFQKFSSVQPEEAKNTMEWLSSSKVQLVLQQILLFSSIQPFNNIIYDKQYIRYTLSALNL